MDLEIKLCGAHFWYAVFSNAHCLRREGGGASHEVVSGSMEGVARLLIAAVFLLV